MQQSRSIQLYAKDGKISRAWDIFVTSDDKDPYEIDVKTLADALVQAAMANLITKAEQELLALKGKRGTKYTAQRQELKAKIAQLKLMQQLGLDLPWSISTKENSPKVLI